jgi:PAS domain S-box-containing protein
LGVRSSGQEITERKQVELEIKEANDQFELIFNTSPDGTLITSMEGEIINVNERLGAALGYTREELIGRSIYDLRIWHDPEARKIFTDLLEAQGYCENFEAVTERKDGRLLHGLISAKIIQLHGEPHIFSITRDITGRKQAEKAAQLISETQARLLHADQLEEAYRLVGARVHEIIGEGYLLVSMLDEQNQGTKLLEIFGLGDLLDTVIATVGFDPAKTVYLFKEMPEGALRPYAGGRLESCSLYDLFLHRVPKLACETLKRLLNIRYFYAIGLTWDNRHFGGLIICSPHDLSDRALAIETLVSQGAITIHRLWVEKELRLRNIILSTQQEASIDGVLVVDENNQILSSNHRFMEMWSIPQALLSSKDDTQVLNWVVSKTAHPEEFLEQVKKLYEVRTQTSQDEIPLKDGRIFERYSAPMHDAQGNYYGRVWYFHDITQRRALYDQLYQAQKMESIGRLASGIAHEINNPLTVVQGNIKLIRRIWTQDIASLFQNAEQTRAYPIGSKAISDLFGSLEKSSVRMRQIIDGMRHFAQSQSEALAVIDPAVCIQDALEICQPKLKTRVETFVEVEPPSFQTRGNAVQITQILVNFIGNAADALGGTPNARIQIRASGTPEQRLRFSVQDNGPGIASETQEKLWAPFYTTNPAGIGTGLGLFICKSIMEEHGGRIGLSSSPGAGAEFYFELLNEADFNRFLDEKEKKSPPPECEPAG